MKHKRNNQNGFGVTEVFVIALVVAGVVIGGWYIWSRTSSTPQTAQSTTPSPNPNAGYTTIQEWGVRFKPVAGLQDFRYFKVTDSSTDTFAVSTAALIAKEPQCGKDGFATITRQKQPPVVYEKSLATIGEYTYYYTGSDSACSQESVHFQQESQERARVLESLGSLEAMK